MSCKHEGQTEGQPVAVGRPCGRSGQTLWRDKRQEGGTAASEGRTQSAVWWPGPDSSSLCSSCRRKSDRGQLAEAEPRCSAVDELGLLSGICRDHVKEKMGLIERKVAGLKTS
ncbi:uncharacterized protein V6R79_017718 [Siganus canaliculatus]